MIEIATFPNPRLASWVENKKEVDYSALPSVSSFPDLKAIVEKHTEEINVHYPIEQLAKDVASYGGANFLSYVVGRADADEDTGTAILSALCEHGDIPTLNVQEYQNYLTSTALPHDSVGSLVGYLSVMAEFDSINYHKVPNSTVDIYLFDLVTSDAGNGLTIILYVYPLG